MIHFWSVFVLQVHTWQCKNTYLGLKNWDVYKFDILAMGCVTFLKN